MTRNAQFRIIIGATKTFGFHVYIFDHGYSTKWTKFVSLWEGVHESFCFYI